MKRYYKITPEGTKDLLFEECRTRSYVQEKIEKVFNSRGFHKVITPGIEYFDLFSIKNAGIRQEALYKFSDNKGRLLALRADSTLPIARLAATRLQNEVKPIRLYYMQEVYRNNPGLMGKKNEVMQSGVELLGASGLRADLEIITTACDSLNKCVGDFRIELSYAGFLKSLLDDLDVSEEIKEDIRIFIESKNYSSLDSLLDGLEQKEIAEYIRNVPRMFGGEAVLDEAYEFSHSKEIREKLGYLKKIYALLKDYGLENKLMIDLGLVNRNDYYSDIVFSGYVEGLADAVLTGGRYDKLLDNFGFSLPAMGFGIDIDSLTSVVLDRENINPKNNVEALVHGEDGFEIKAIDYAISLRKKGIICEDSVFNNLNEVLEYAKKKHISKVYLINESVKELLVK